MIFTQSFVCLECGPSINSCDCKRDKVRISRSVILLTQSLHFAKDRNMINAINGDEEITGKKNPKKKQNRLQNQFHII